MKLKLVIITVVTILVFSSFAVATYGIQQSNPEMKQAITTLVPANVYTGNLTIYANGTVSNSTLIQQSGSTYSLETNLSGTLTVLRNNSVVSGNGYFMTPAYAYSVFMNNTTNSVLTNLNITSTTNGISLNGTYNVAVENSNITAYSHAIYIMASDWVQVDQVNITVTSTGGDGIYVDMTPSFLLSLSSINAPYGVYFESSTSFTGFYNDYFTVSEDAIDFEGSVNSYIVLRDSTLNGTGSGTNGLYVDSYMSNNDTIFNNTFMNLKGNGIDMNLDYGVNFSVTNNQFINNSDPVYFGDAINVTISNNNFSGFSDIAVESDYGLNVFVTGNKFTGATSVSSYAIYLDYSGGAAKVANNIIDPNSSVVSSSFEAVYIYKSSAANVSNNVINNSSYAIDVEYDNTVTALYNSGVNDANAIYLYSYATDNVKVIGNTFLNGSSTSGYAFYADFKIGTNWYVNNNTFAHFEEGIYLSYDILNLTINGNHLYNITDEAIYSDYNSNITVLYNVIENINTSQSYAIDVEYFTVSGIIAHNTIISMGPIGGEGIFVVGSTYGQVFDNKIVNQRYSLDIEDSGYITVTNNAVQSGDYGVYTEYNFHVSFYGNTVVNSNYSIYSTNDYNDVFYGNTFQNSTNMTIEMFNSVNNVLYHNNFLNGTNVTTYMSNNINLTWNFSSPIGGNYWSSYNGSFSNGFGTTPYVINGTKDYLPLQNMWTQYTISFEETGLPSGTAWSATLGSSTITSTETLISFSPTAAQPVSETYTISPVNGYKVSSLSGTVQLNGTSDTIGVSYSPYVFDASFTESGLPSGTSWSVTLNGHLMTSTTNSVTFTVPNGTYNYTINSVQGYHVTSSSGTVTVDNGTQSTSVTFTQNTYTLTLKETGLPAGDNWTATVNGKTYTTTSTELTVSLPSGTYNVSVTAPSGYKVSVNSNVTLNSGNASMAVTFTQKSSVAGLAEGIGIGVAVGAVVAAMVLMFYTGTGIFSNRKKGQ